MFPASTMTVKLFILFTFTVIVIARITGRRKNNQKEKKERTVRTSCRHLKDSPSLPHSRCLNRTLSSPHQHLHTFRAHSPLGNGLGSFSIQCHAVISLTKARTLPTSLSLSPITKKRKGQSIIKMAPSIEHSSNQEMAPRLLPLPPIIDDSSDAKETPKPTVDPPSSVLHLNVFAITLKVAKAFIFLSYVTCFCSYYFLVSFSHAIDRVLSRFLPLLRSSSLFCVV